MIAHTQIKLTVACAVAASALSAFAQSEGARPEFTFLVSYHSGTYEDTSKNEEPLAVGEQTDVKLTGQALRFSIGLGHFDIETGARMLFPAKPYWNRRAEYDVGTTYYAPEVPYLGISANYLQVHQIGDRNHADAPPALIQANRIMGLGMKTDLPPWFFMEGHGAEFQLGVQYLTTYEKSQNFGVEQNASLAWVYTGAGLPMALVLGYTNNFFNASVEDPDDEDNSLHARHNYVINSVGFYTEL